MVKKKSDVADTSADYDTMIGFKETKDRPGSLAGFLGMTDIPETEEEAWDGHNRSVWLEQWKGMPAYTSNDLKPIKQLIMNFDSEEAVTAFAELIGQKLTMKTKSVFYPEKKRDDNALNRWIDENDLEFNTEED